MTSDLGVRVRRALAPGLLLVALVAGMPVMGQEAPPEGQPSAQEAAEARARAEWSSAMAKVPTPRQGCFTAAFPAREWREVPCGTAPDKPYPPAMGHRPQIVGGSNDFAAEVAGTLTSAEGSFDSVSGVTSESGNVGGNPPAVANTYSLQLNTKPFTTSVCGPSPNPGCLGWQQFIFSNSGSAFIQYWLLKYNTTCPAGWNTFSFPPPSTDVYCWRNGPNATAVASQPITSLGSLRLAGSAAAGGNDTVTMTTAGGVFSASNADTLLNLASGWTGVEFIVVGDCCSSQANFNAGSTIVVRTTTHNGTRSAPTCVQEGFTGETNNLNLVGTTASTTGPSPAVISTQSNVAGGSAAGCVAASGVGDTHLTTFGGLLYDFQASGDFLLAETGADFAVQVRQVSGAPTWPNAAINKAVAVRAGKDEVAICAEPKGIAINGVPARMRDARMLELADGGDVVRKGNVYVVRAPDGSSVRAAVLNAGNIDVSVGLGRWPEKVWGLLANAPGGKVDQIATSEGAVLTSPFAFQEFYGRYGASWRLPEDGSMLVKGCGQLAEKGDPERPFTMRDLDPELAKRASVLCEKAGVTEGPLMQACTLDVAVIGRPAAARVFVGQPAPVAVGMVQ